MQTELKSETLTLTLEVKGRGAYLVRVSLPPPVRRTRLRRRSPDISAQRSRRLPLRDAGVAHAGLESLAPSMASSTAARSPTGERAHRRASRDGAASPSPLRSPWPSPPLRGCRCVVWREKGEERMTLGFGARRRRRGFVLAKTADVRPIEINGRESASPSGPASGPGRRGRGHRGGPFRRPGRWLSGLGPKEGWPSRPRAGFALGLLNSVFRFIIFSIFPEAISIAF